MNLLTFFLMAPPAEGEGSGYTSLIFMGAIFVVFYFFIIRPQSKKQTGGRTECHPQHGQLPLAYHSEQRAAKRSSGFLLNSWQLCDASGWHLDDVRCGQAELHSNVWRLVSFRRLVRSSASGACWPFPDFWVRDTRQGQPRPVSGRGQHVLLCVNLSVHPLKEQ